MSKIQPGSGYGFTSSGYGFTLNTEDPFAAFNQGALGLHPLQVYGLRYDTATNTAFYKVYPGTINNIVPQIEVDTVWVKLDRLTDGIPDPPEGVITTSAGLYYIYLRTGPDATSSQYPSDDTTSARYPRIISVGTVQTDTDTEAYILLAHGSISGSNVITNYQDVSSSLWADRIKLGTDTAQYYYARI